MSRNNSLHKQRGTAIIMALFVMAIAVAASVTMMARLQIDIRRTQSILNAEQINQYEFGAVAWAIDKLNMDWQQKKTDQLVDKTPIASEENTVNGYKIKSVIYDAQGLFNLNNLTSSDYQFDFIRLLKNVAPKLTNPKAMALTISIRDWVGPSANTQAATFYAGLNPGYKAPHAPMASISELRLVKDMTPTLYTQVLPYLIALPTITTVNVNNAPAAVLMSLGQNISYAAVQKLIELRRQTPFQTPEAFTNNEAIKSSGIDTKKITVLSNYFLLETKVSIGQQQTILYTLLSRATQGQKATTMVVWQMKGTL